VISPTARYAEGEVLWVTTASRGAKQTLYLNTVTVLLGTYTAAFMREGDNLTLVAHSAYKDPGRWWAVADANPQVFYPLDIIPGTSVRVPQ
jgi:hypothetical protein